MYFSTSNGIGLNCGTLRVQSKKKTELSASSQVLLLYHPSPGYPYVSHHRPAPSQPPQLPLARLSPLLVSSPLPPEMQDPDLINEYVEWLSHQVPEVMILHVTSKMIA